MCYCCFDSLDDDETKEIDLNKEGDEEKDKLDVFDVFSDIEDVEWDIDWETDSITEELTPENVQKLNEKYCQCSKPDLVESYVGNVKFLFCRKCKKEAV